VVEFDKQPYDLAQAFATGQKAGAGGIVLLNSPVFRARINEILALATKYRLPSAGSGGYPGVLLAYHADLGKGAARVAALGARILGGAKPADIPVEQQGEFQLVVNLKTARALGLKMPQSLMLRATRVIE
jgi:putative ABC transport system substrate-binding protein